MGMTALDRKTVVRKLGLNNGKIARTLEVDQSMVGHVIAGRRSTSPTARKIMAFLAETAQIDIDEMFPGSERRKPDVRPFPAPTDADSRGAA